MRKFPHLSQMFLVVGTVFAVLVLGSYPLIHIFGDWIQKTQTEPYVKREIEKLKKSVANYIPGLQSELTNPVPDGSSLVDLTPGLTPDQPNTTTIVKEFTTYTASASSLPSGQIGSILYYSSDGWKAGTEMYYNGSLGVGTIDPKAKLHVSTAGKDTIGLIVQGVTNQSALLQDFRDAAGNSLANINSNGKLTINNSSNDHAIEIYQSGNAGYLSSNGGAIYLNNTNNIGTGIGIFSNAGAEAMGNMINVKVDNPLYNQAAFYMNYDGTSNAVEIIANTNDDSSNALSITNNNVLDSALGVIGYETSKGTIKVSHNGTGSDANASGLSIDLKGSGTRAQGLYVDSTATTGTTGNLLRLRNQSIDRFVVNSAGSLTLGVNGTDTSITKNGNVVGDQFFVGTNGAFRVQRSATDSEAFRVQVNGDAQGRWLGTSDGKLKWGDGTSTQDVVLKRSAANTLQLQTSTLQITSRANNTDLQVWTASDSSRLARLSETSGGAGFFEIEDAAGAAQVLFRADGGNSYINTGNFGLGTTSFGTGANKVFAIGNGTAPSTSITGGVQLYAINYDDTDGTATSELFVRDEDGNATNLSPHNFSVVPQGKSEPLAWSYYSEKNGQAINVDMAKTVRLVEQLSGTQLIYMKDLQTGESISSSLSRPTTLSPLQTLAMNSLDSAKHELSKELEKQNDMFITKQLLSENITFSGNMIEILKNLVVSAGTVFKQSVEFMAAVVFHSDVVFEKNIEVKGTMSVNNDQAGEAIIKAGQTEVQISFVKEFAIPPLITVTPESQIKGSYWISKSEKEFIIHIAVSQDHDVSFDWHAMVTKEKNVVTSPETSSTILPTLVPTEIASPAAK